MNKIKDRPGKDTSEHMNMNEISPSKINVILIFFNGNENTV